MNDITNSAQYLRAQVTLPKLTGLDYYKTSKHRLAYEQLIGTIWRTLIQRLEDPIKITEGKLSRRVEVLGITRYYVNHRTQQVTCRTLEGQCMEDGWQFSFKPTSHVMVDPPFSCNKTIIGYFVKQWRNEVDELTQDYLTESKADCYTESLDSSEVRLDQITHAIFTAIRSSTYWKHLRHAIFNALALDPELVKLARLSRPTLKALNLSELHFNSVCKHRIKYRQIHQDVPHLLWAYTIATQQGILKKVSSNPIGDLKQVVLNKGCTQRGWRLLANSKQRDFDQVIDCSRGSWRYLIEYIQLHERLDRSRVISPRLASLFDNPNWHLPHQNKYIVYRDVELQPNVLNKFIDETLHRQSLGQSQQFAEEEVSIVWTWFAKTKIQFDANQLRQPWRWFAKKATEWFTEQVTFGKLSQLKWHCGLPEETYQGYRFKPLTNAWQVRVEAVKQRHCVDQYIQRCLEGSYRAFSVQNIKSKTKYTLGLRLYDEWEVDQITGFANRPVSQELEWLCQVIADGLNILEEGELKSINEQKRLNAESFLDPIEWDNSGFQLID